MARRINQADSYFKVQVEGASPMELIHILYDGAIRGVSGAKNALISRERETFCNNVIFAQDCLRELRASINMDIGKISSSLYGLYSNLINLLIDVNIKRENQKGTLNLIEKILKDLKMTWIKAEDKLNTQEKKYVPQAKEENIQQVPARSLSITC